MSSTTCSVREEALSPELLAALGRMWHERKAPGRPIATIVVVEHLNGLVVVDGNTRVNLWREVGVPAGGTAIIITPRAEAFRGPRA